MYRGFNLNVPENIVDHHYELGLSMHTRYKKLVKDTLGEFCKSNGEIDATKMQRNWFPTIGAHIFMSHSHEDERKAICFAGWLKSFFGVDTFIDSCAWGNSSDLLKMIDDQFCWNDGGETYNYNKRNQSTSHVHMMLSTALNMMIDNSECIFFLNTPSSITPNGIVNNVGTTKSPWIYAEIAATKLIRRRSKDDHRGIIKESEMRVLAKAARLNFQYELTLGHLTDLNIDSFKTWTKSFSTIGEDPHGALDLLYRLNPELE